jgi:hypothetical protein
MKCVEQSSGEATSPLGSQEIPLFFNKPSSEMFTTGLRAARNGSWPHSPTQKSFRVTLSFTTVTFKVSLKVIFRFFSLLFHNVEIANIM